MAEESDHEAAGVPTFVGVVQRDVTMSEANLTAAVKAQRYVALDDYLDAIAAKERAETERDKASSHLEAIRQHLEDRMQAVYEARIEQEKRGEAGKMHVVSLQKELDTLSGVREFVESQCRP